MTTMPNTHSVADPAAAGQAALVAKHKERLDAALAAIAGRGYWSAYPESPSPRVYGEGTAEAGRAAFDALLGKPFTLGQPGADGWAGDEVSPYGLTLGVTYEHLSADALIGAASAALPGWRAASPEVRAAVCLEIIGRLNARTFEIAHAVMHTSGQAFVMAFQVGNVVQPTTRAMPRGTGVNVFSIRSGGRLPCGFSHTATSACLVCSAYA